MIARTVAVPGFRPPRQERSRATVERIVAATMELLVERGPEGVTIHEIVERADSSIGSFYARFDDRDAAVRYVQDRFWMEVEARWMSYLAAVQWDGRSALEVIASVIRQFVRIMMADQSKFRPFLLQALDDSQGTLLERTAALDYQIANRMSELLKASGSLSEDLPEWMPHEGFVRVLGAIRDAVVFSDRSQLASQRLALTLVLMYASSLGIEGTPQTWPELLALCHEDSPVHRTPSR